MAPTSYLISGTNRGIGYAFVEHLASQGDCIIFAGARDPTHAALVELASRFPGIVYPVRLRSTNEEDHREVIELIRERVGSLDVVIANAGIAKSCPVATIPIADAREHLEINTLGLLVIFQATLPLLLLSPHPLRPRLIGISTWGASQSSVSLSPFPVAAYAASKAAMNHYLLRIHCEVKELTVVVMHPGMVDSDMGLRAAKNAGEFWKGISPAESAEALLRIIQTATREGQGGKFLNYDGREIPW